MLTHLSRAARMAQICCRWDTAIVGLAIEAPNTKLHQNTVCGCSLGFDRGHPASYTIEDISVIRPEMLLLRLGPEPSC